MKKLLKSIIPFELRQTLRKPWQEILAIWFFGNDYCCPICGKSFRKLFDGGIKSEFAEKNNITGFGFRKNHTCPYCQSSHRDRLVFLFLKNETKIFSEQISLLHIAPEYPLMNVFRKFKNINYIAGDKFESGYEYSKYVVSLDITATNFSDNKFDFIICNHVLEHIPNETLAIKEIYRILKPNGIAILQVPISHNLSETLENTSITNPSEREKIYGQSDHCRLYAKDYKNKLEKSGFKVELYNTSEKEILLYCLDNKEELYVAIK